MHGDTFTPFRYLHYSEKWPLEVGYYKGEQLFHLLYGDYATGKSIRSTLLKLEPLSRIVTAGFVSNLINFISR